MAKVVLENVTKKFTDNTVLSHLTLDVHDGEFLVLLGPSGCGKTTALRTVAGLEDVTAGRVLIGDHDVTTLPPRERDIAMVFQSYALYPHMTVSRNVSFPLENSKLSGGEIMKRVSEALSVVELKEYAQRKPGQLSGGQRQRVALARAIVRRPSVFLMDEPLSNLDATLRVQTRADIVRLQRELGTTTIFVTHDQVEAMTMGDRIAVMNAGVLQQVGKPTDIYNAPVNAFVAGFLGSPGMNLLRGVISNNQILVGGSVVAPTSFTARESVTVGVRSEHLELSGEGFRAKVVIVEDLGSSCHVVCVTPEGDRVVVTQSATHPRPLSGENVCLSVRGDDVHLFDAQSGLRVSA